ncbi:MAG TPA: DUF1223 domain-containing protein [Beijerinckiaceae bacterium]|jgi:hypothetical protein
MILKPISRLAALLAGSLAAAVAFAGESPRAVVELFTSQGCSSCPPADQVLADLAREPDVIALSLPVDYWDYLGWKDTLASPAFSARQRAYSNARGDRQVFTPQMIVNGKVSCVGSDRAQIGRSMARASGGRERLPVRIDLAEVGPTLLIEVGRGDPPTSGEVWVLPVAKAREVAIGRGENRGRSVTYANVVRGMTRAGFWSGAPARLEVPLKKARDSDADSYVVLLQAGDPDKPGPILGAAKGPGL